MGKVDDGLLVGGCEVVNFQLVVVCPSVFHVYLHLSREAFVAVWRYERQCKALLIHLHRVPYLRMEAGRSSVQGVGTIVYGKLVFLAPKGKASFANAVAKAANER